MISLFTIAYLLDTVLAGPCGTPPVCQCQPDLGIVLCSGMNVIGIPSFPEEVTSSALFLDVVSTNIMEMPSLNEWTKLEWVTLKGNRRFDCNFTVENIYVDTDCVSASNSIYYDIDADYFTPEESELFKIMSPILFVPFGFTFVSVYACMLKSRRNRFRETNKRCSFNRPETQPINPVQEV